MRSRTIIIFAAVCIVAAGTLIFWLVHHPTTASPPDLVAVIDGPTMGSHWMVKFGKPTDAATAEQHKAAIQSILDRIDGEMSTWKPASDVSRFNAHRETDWFPVPAELAAITATSQEISAQTDGAFD